MINLYMKNTNWFKAFVMSLFMVSCSTNKEPIEPVADYETVSLQVNTDFSEEARLAFYEAGNNKASTTFGADGTAYHVYTTISKGSRVYFRGNLPWTVTNGGKRLEYKGELKIKVYKDANGTDPVLRMVCIPNDGNPPFVAPGSFILQYNMDKKISYEGDKMGHIPFVMITSVRRKTLTGPGVKTLVNVDPGTSQFRMKGNLVRFRVSNIGSTNLHFDAVTITPYHVPSMHISALTGSHSLHYRYNKDGADHYIQLDNGYRETIRPYGTSKLMQFWTPLHAAHNEANTLPQTPRAPYSPLYIYVYSGNNPQRLLMESEKTSPISNSNKFGKQIYYNVSEVRKPIPV